MTSRGLVEMPSAAKVPSPETAPDLRAARAATLVGEMRAWALLATAALAIAGIFAFLLAVSRLPGIEATGVWPLGFFTKGLVIHVVFSLVVWFLAVFALMATDAAYEASRGTPRLAALGSAGTGLVAIAMPLLFLPAFLDDTVATLNNYVPVIVHRAYYLGLTLLALGVALPGARLLASLERPRGDASPYVLALSAGAIVYFAALACVALSLLYSWGGEPNRIFHEHLFWGGGHVLQFTWTLLMLVAWVWLAEAIGARLPLTPRIATLFYGVGLVSVFATPVVYLAWDIVSMEHYRYLTWIMRFGGGLAILPFALAVGIGLATLRGMPEEGRPLRAALVASMALFGAGGVIGFLIEGSNVKIPAHYHGCIVGVTLALMGLAYHLLPLFGFAAVPPRAGALQAWLYGGGQLAHVAGLAWSGGYGVQRKAVAAEQALRTPQEIVAMGLMGLGGLVAVIGGLLFLVLVLRAIRTGWRGFAAQAIPQA
jgi:hypothetical protein